jgi:S-DNA-T family DNA segregation ATPase FtsK/SpoIIIE
MKHFGLIQSEFIEKTANIALSSSVDVVQSEFLKTASDSGRQLSSSELELLHHIAANRKKVKSKKLKRRKEKAQTKKSPASPKETSRSFIEEVGDKEVKNPDPKGKKPTVKIKSLKSGEKNSPQRRMYEQLYQQWLKSRKKKEKPKDKKVEKVKDKIERAKKDLKKKHKITLKDKIDEKRKQILQRLESERLEKLKLEKKKQPAATKTEPVVETAEKPIEQPAKTEPVTEKPSEEVKLDKKTELNVVDKSEEDYKATMKRVSENAPKLTGSVSFLKDPVKPSAVNIDEAKRNVDVITNMINRSAIKGNIDDFSAGPVFSTYHVKIDVDDLHKVKSLAEKLSFETGKDVIVAPNRERKTIDVEIQNDKRSMVTFKEMVTDDNFIKQAKNPDAMPIILGKDKTGKVLTLNLRDERTPHVLIVGQTGAGKTVLMHQIIASVLYGKTSDEAEVMLLDPKGGAEFGRYDGSASLFRPVAKTPEDAVRAVKDLHTEMERRYKLFDKAGVNSINSFNKLVKKDLSEMTDDEKSAFNALSEEEQKPIKETLLICDELSNLMKSSDQARSELIKSITALGQKARASGINMVLATQFPSRLVIPSEIQNNLPAKVIMKVDNSSAAKYVDSPGAENLLGRGDMIVRGIGDDQRVQAGFIDTNTEANDVAKQFGGSGQVRKKVKPVTEEKPEEKVAPEFVEFREHMKKTRERLEERRKKLDQMLEEAEAKDRELAKKRREIEERGRGEETRGSELADVERERENMIEPTDTEEEVESAKAPATTTTEVAPETDDKTKKEIEELTTPKPVTSEELARLKPAAKPAETEKRKKSLWDRLKGLRSKLKE